MLRTLGGTQAIRPGTGRLGDGASAEREALTALQVLGLKASHPALLPLQCHHSHTIQRLAAIRAGFAQHPHHQTGIVRHGIEESGAAL
ncbi:hypothetical protein D9M68_924870 [compost metagenome]